MFVFLTLAMHLGYTIDGKGCKTAGRKTKSLKYKLINSHKVTQSGGDYRICLKKNPRQIYEPIYTAGTPYETK